MICNVKTAKQLRIERQERLRRAMRNEKNDRVPVLGSGEPALLRYARPDATFGYMIREPEKVADIVIEEVLSKLTKFDMLCTVGISARYLGAAFLGKTLLPGKELPEDTMWQPVMNGIMTVDDYDTIIDKGWDKFRELCLSDRLGYDLDEMATNFEIDAKNVRKYHDAGIPYMLGNMLPTPFDNLAFGRGIMDFMIDLTEIPEKVLEVFHVILDEFEEKQKDTMRRAVYDAALQGERILYTVAPCVYANCNILSHDMFDKFGWPLIERETNFLIDIGADVFFHMDTNWTNVLDYFKTFPKGRCIFDSDGGTDLYKLRDTLGNQMAITGVIKPDMMAFGKPDNIYRECCKQIDEMGDSFILAPSCSFPANMPRENLEAFYAAIPD